MNNLEFISYIPTPKEKHLGIASIKYNGVVLRYRVSPGKEGKGFYAQPSAYKISDEISGEESYISAFMIDSMSENERVGQFVRSHIKKAGNKASVQSTDDIPF